MTINHRTPIHAVHAFQALGVPTQPVLQQLQAIQLQARRLDRMIGDFSNSAGAMTLSQVMGLAHQGALGAGTMVQNPVGASASAAANYAVPRRIDFGAESTAPLDPTSFGRRKKAMALERFLQRSPFARQRLEMMMGGNIKPDGVADGVLSVEPFQSSHRSAAPGGSFDPAPAMTAVDGVQRGATMMGADPFGQNLFQQMMLGALVNTLQPGLAAGAASGPYPTMPGPNPIASVGPAANGQANAGGFGPIGNIMNAPGMTIEDQVVLLLMQVSKRFDRDLQQQAQQINAMQQQQQGANGQAGGSIDVATMKLKRLIDKRGQMFDMLRQIIDKYNETAKNMIGTVGR